MFDNMQALRDITDKVKREGYTAENKQLAEKVVARAADHFGLLKPEFRHLLQD